MQPWVMFVLLAVFVALTVAGATMVAVQANRGAVAQYCGGQARGSRLTDVGAVVTSAWCTGTACEAETVYPTVFYGTERELVDQFPLQAAFAVYLRSLDAESLTATFKAKYPRFEPLLTDSGWTVRRCYVKEPDYSGSTASVPRGDSMNLSSRTPTVVLSVATSVAMHVVDASGTPRLVLVTAPVTDTDAEVWVLFTTESATDPATYAGTWTRRFSDGTDRMDAQWSVQWSNSTA